MIKVKLLSAILAAGIISIVTAQSGVTNAIDFTAKDVNGQNHHLFEYLEDGKWVLIKFTSTGWSSCWSSTVVEEINAPYIEYGQNQNNLIILAVCSDSDDATVKAKADQSGIKFPVISGASGGSSIFSSYKVNATPTIILIKPDKSLAEQDIWPVSNLESTLDGHNIDKTSIFVQNNSKLLNVKLTANNSGLEIKGLSEGSYNLKVFNLMGRNILDQKSTVTSKSTISLPDLKLSSGVYLLSILGKGYKEQIKFRVR